MNLNTSLWIHNLKLLEVNKCYNMVSLIEVGRYPNQRIIISPNYEEYAGKFKYYIKPNNNYYSPTQLSFIKFDKEYSLNILTDYPKRDYKFREINCY